MCEACSDPKLEWEETTRVPAGDQRAATVSGEHQRADVFCDEEDCMEPAAWRTRFAYVDEHVCEAHKEEDGDPALQQMLEATGLGEGGYFVGIRAAEPCEGALLGPPCQARAAWAHVMVAQAYACERHAARKADAPGAHG